MDQFDTVAASLSQLEQDATRALGSGRGLFARDIDKARAAVRRAAEKDIEREIEEKKISVKKIADSGELKFRLDLPFYAPPRANSTMHHMERHKKFGDLRPAVAMALRAYASRARFKPTFPCVVRITRLDPKRLDEGDNLEMACKPIRDSVADWLGINDATPAVHWICAQEHPKPRGIRIEVLA